MVVRRGAQINAVGVRQGIAAREIVVEKQTDADHPRGPQRRHMRHHETHRMHDMRRGTQQHFALGERFAHQTEFVLLKITQTAMHQFAAGRRGVLREIVLLAQQDFEATAGGVACDAGAVDAAAYNQ